MDRSTLRVTMTIVSPIASSAMIAAPESRFWMLDALRKLELSIVVAATTITSANTMPSSRKRNSVSATTCEDLRRSTTFRSSASVVTLRPRRSPWRRA